MDKKISQLTATIYKEGVEKAEEKAKQIIADAKTQAAQIINDAKKESENIISSADAQAEELKRNVASEIKLSGQQALSAIKQRILDVITAKVVDGSVKSALSDSNTMKEYIKSIVQNWKVSNGVAPKLEILLPENNREELERSLTGGLSKILNTGYSVSFSKNIRGGFQIGPKDSSYKISMTDEDFIEFFKDYLRPKTKAFLFDEK